MMTKLSLQSLIFSLSVIGGGGVSFLGVIPAIAENVPTVNPSPHTITRTDTPFNSDNSVCSTFIPLTNTVKPNETSPDLPSPTSFCAKDLIGVKSAWEMTQTSPETPVILEEDEPSTPIEETAITKDNNGWHFKLQPYVTIPVSTYGTATVRGRSVDYHLSLGETLQNLRVAASGRFEGWKGRWGFIVDGYYVSLQGIADFQRDAERIPNTLNALNYLLSKDVNSRAQNLATVLDQNIENLERVAELRQIQPVQTLKQTVQILQVTVAQDAQTLRDLEADLQAAQIGIEQKESQLQAAESNFQQRVQTFQETVAQDAQTLRDLDADLQEVQAEINQRESQLQGVEFNLEQREFLNLDQKELERVIALNNQEIQGIANEKIETALTELEDLDFLQQQLIETRDSLEEVSQELGDVEAIADQKIETATMGLETLESVQQQFIEARDSLEQVSQEISELRAIKDSPELQQLEIDVENAKVILGRDIQALEQVQNFAENRDPQQFNANLTTDLQFDQGIYDFALSYHIGEVPLTELPENPSNRSYPLLWFQPIAGVRLNSIDIEIQQAIDLSLSSSLVNFQGTFEETFKGGRTWFEPMLGGKLGLQISDPVTFWVRGDVSGFGLAGERDLSWNVFFGVDWWIRRQLSLQFAYHFYHIDYQIGQGNNAFGFTQNLNGPYLSATFHF
jgi:hypothetical protein